jgi:tetratricopeptide (TPR) repeat protein
MDVKNQIEQGGESKLRHDLIRRLAKAVSHTTDLVRLTSEICDHRTALEAEAYTAWMNGNYLLEKETDWQGALTSFLKSKKLLEELSKVGTFDQQAVCRHFIDQVEPTVRYCSYQMSRKGGGGAATTTTQDTAALLGEVTASGNSLLSSRLSALAAEAQTQVGEAASELEWGSEKLPVRNGRVRIALQAANDAKLDLEEKQKASGVNDGGDAFETEIACRDRLANAYNETATAAHGALQLGQSGPNANQVRSELEAVERAARGLAFQVGIDRNVFMAKNVASQVYQNLKNQAAGGGGGGGSGGTKTSKQQQSKGNSKDRQGKPEDVVRLLDAALQGVAQLNELAAEIGGAAGEHLIDDCAAKQAQIKASRCLYAGHSYMSIGKYREALALFQRVKHLCKDADLKIDDCAVAPEGGKGAVNITRHKAAAFEAAAAAELRAAELREAYSLGQDVGGMDLDNTTTSNSNGKRKSLAIAAVDGKYLEECMNDNTVWESFYSGEAKEVPRFAKLPPLPAPVPVRPIFLDTALNCMHPPSLDHRASKKQKAAAAAAGGDHGAGGGMVSRLFGWGGAAS